MKVAVGVIVDEEGRILLTQRPLHVAHGGSWEFPGGKLEENETAEVALRREMKEEIDIDVVDCRFMGEIHHQYPTNRIQLIIFEITAFIGTPRCLEGQLAMQWVEKKALNPEHFPEANKAVIDLIMEQ